MRILALSLALVVPLFTNSYAADSTTKTMSFEDCLKAIWNTAAILGVMPINIVETKDLMMVRFPTADGSLLVTCSRPEQKMVVTVSD